LTRQSRRFRQRGNSLAEGAPATSRTLHHQGPAHARWLCSVFPLTTSPGCKSQPTSYSGIFHVTGSFWTTADQKERMSALDHSRLRWSRPRLVHVRFNSDSDRQPSKRDRALRARSESKRSLFQHRGFDRIDRRGGRCRRAERDGKAELHHVVLPGEVVVE